MTITATGLTKAASAAAAVAGTIYVAVQINHPPLVVASTETTEWVVRSGAKVVFTALALVGITGMYLRQYRRAGVLGLIGYLLFAAGFLTLFSVEVISAAVLPHLAQSEPGYVNDVLATAAGSTPAGDIGGVQTLLNVSALGYLGGGLLFGIALFRTGVLARWAAALLAVGTVGTAALAVLPESFNRPIAVPVGIALIGLGVSLWRDQSRHPAPEAVSTAASVPVREPATR
jgi:hypothetical protein